MDDNIDHGYVRAVALDRLREKLSEDGFPAEVSLQVAELLKVYSDNAGIVDPKTSQPLQKKLIEALDKMPSTEEKMPSTEEKGVEE